MSYRHPKFFKEDHGAFMRNFESSFEKSYNGAMEHFDQKIADRKEYTDDLMAQADAMRKEGESMENFSAEAQTNLESEIQKFLKEGLKVEDAEGRDVNDEDFKGGFFGQSINESGKKNQLQIDEANASFNAEIGAINKFSDRTFVEGLDLQDDYDLGSASYVEYASIVKGLKNNFAAGGKMDFKYDSKNKFKAGIEIPNPEFVPPTIKVEGKAPIPNPDYYAGVNDGVKEMKTYSASEMQRIISENDPEARKAFEERYNTAQATLEGQAKARLDQVYAQGNAYKTDGKGAAYLGKTAVANVVKNYMAELQRTDENNPDADSHIDDIFNNKIKFNDKVRLEVLESTGGTDLMNMANQSAANADNVAQLLDLPHNAVSKQKKILEAMWRRSAPNIQGVNNVGTKEEWMKTQLSSLENARNGMVERYLNNELMGSGITSKYIKPSLTDDRNDGSGSGTDDGTDIRSSVVATNQAAFQFTEAKGEDFSSDEMYEKLGDSNLLPRGDGKLGPRGMAPKKWFSSERDQISKEEFDKILSDPKKFAEWKKKVKESGSDVMIEKFSQMSADIVGSKVPDLTGTEVDGKRVQNQTYDPTNGELTMTFDVDGKDQRIYKIDKLSGDMQLYLDQMGYGDKQGKTIEQGTKKFMEEKMPMLVDNRYSAELGGGDGMYSNYFDASNAGAGMDKVFQDYMRRKSIADYQDINTGLSNITAGNKNTPIAITPDITITPSDGIEKIMKQVDMLADKGQGDIYKKVIDALANLNK